MSDTKTQWAQFNALTITGRVARLEKIQIKGKDFLSVTLATTMVKDGPTMAVKFLNNNGLLTMFTNGNLDTGRLLTVTGHITGFSEIYFDKKTGKTRRLGWPELKLNSVQVFDGGLGAKPGDGSKSNDVEIDDIDEVAADAGLTTAK